jgi:hypothetical protein
VKIGPFTLSFLPVGTERTIDLDCCDMTCAVTRDVEVGEVIELIREYWPEGLSEEPDDDPLARRNRAA